MKTAIEVKELKAKLSALQSKEERIKMIWMWIRQDVVDLQTFKQLLSYCETSSDDSDKIKITKEELTTFMNDASTGTGVWSDTSYRICRFIDIDPTDGL